MKSAKSVFFLFGIPLVITLVSTLFFARGQLVPDKKIQFDETIHRIVLSKGGKKEIITRIESSDRRISIREWWLAKAMQKLPTTEAVSQFIDGESQLRQLANGPVRLILDSGGVETLQFRTRDWRDLSFSFWLHRILALLLFGFAGWVYWLNPGTKGAVVTLLGSWSLAIGYLIATSNFDRQWAVDATVIEWNFIVSRAMVFIFAWSVLSLAWSLPFLFEWQKRLSLLPHAVAIYFAFCYLVNVTGYFSSMSIWYIVPYTLVIVGSMFLLIAKAIVAHRHIQEKLLDWVALRWVLSAAFIGVSFPTVYNLLWDIGMVKEINPVLANAPVILFKLGLAALVVKNQLYRLEKFWWSYWMLVIFIMTLLFLTFISTSLKFNLDNESLVIVMLLAFILAWQSSTRIRDKYRVSLIAMTNKLTTSLFQLGQSAGNPHASEQKWREILDATFQPFSVHQIADDSGLIASRSVRIVNGGASLWVPLIGVEHSDLKQSEAMIGSRQLLQLNGASNGKRIFTKADQKVAEFLSYIAQKSVEAYQAQKAGELSERKRIAADLHDDIGGRLLYLSSAKDRNGEIAQLALDELRNLTRGLSETDRPLSELMADLEFDIMERCEIQNVELTWKVELGELNDHMIDARAATELRCLLSELIRNALQHSRVCQIAVKFCIENKHANLLVLNDGLHTNPENWKKGLGLSSISRRIHRLDGQLDWSSMESGGVSFSADWPIAGWLEY